MQTVNLQLPWPPSVNTYWRHIAMHGRPRVLISKAGREYRQAVCRAAVTAHACVQFEGELAVSIVAYPPDRRARDVDNLLKATLDGMQAAGVYLSDSQITTLSITKSRTVHPGGLLCVGVTLTADSDWRAALKDDAA